MHAMLRAAILGLAAILLPATAFAELGPESDPALHLSSRGTDALKLDDLTGWYADIDHRLAQGSPGLAAASAQAARDALARARSALEGAAFIDSLSASDARALVAAHDDLVAALGLPASERIDCARERRVNSRRQVVVCRVTADALARGERDRDAMRRMSTATGASD